MNRMRKFVRLPLPDQWLLLWSVLLVLAVRLALRLLGFQVVYRWLSRLSGRPNTGDAAANPSRMARTVWAVNVATDCLLPERSCLIKALVAQMLLARQAYLTTLRLGVRLTPAGKLYAHAWLEREGAVVIGQLPDLALFAPLPPLELRN
jgi:hypothetical protein